MYQMRCLHKYQYEITYVNNYSNDEILNHHPLYKFDDVRLQEGEYKIAGSDGETCGQNFRSSKTLPLGEARDLASRKAQGKFLAFLDADDYWSADKLEKQIAQGAKAQLCALELGLQALC